MIRTTQKLILAAIVFYVGFLSCTKAYIVDFSKGGGSQSGTSAFIIPGAGGACPVATVNGNYVADTAVTAANTVAITVNVTTTGSYLISSGMADGITFSATGQFTTTGAQTIQLTSTGTPTAAGTFTYTPGNEGCSFSITVLAAGTIVPAVFTLNGAPNAWATATVNGTYAVGTALAAGNTVAIAANVTTAGTYNITTATVNGITFSGSGTLAVGAQTITLTGSGTPAATGTNSFTAGTGGCSFPVTATAAAPTAVFTLNGSPTACTSPVVSGTYTAGTALGAGNTVAITANVTKAGTYSITTAAVNGITFSASGSLALGAQTITLTASGTPVAAGTNSYTAGAGGCTFPITVTGAAGAAVFSLAGSPNACSAATVNGTYQAGVALTNSNTVTVYVNVTTPGTYIVATTVVGGISFSASGSFSTTGNNVPVTLTGAGTPTSAGPNTFTTSTGSGPTCSFGVTVTPAVTVTAVYNCTIAGVAYSFNNNATASLTDPLLGTPYLFLDGYQGPANGTNQPEFSISITNNNNSSVTAGSYNTNQSNAINPTTGYMIGINYTAENGGTATIWGTSSSIITTNPYFSVVITSVTATSVQGTFSGTLTNIFSGANQTISVTNGTFTLPVQ